jgi:ArsR family transcriptional regulator, cadmium/lead-responsive transcriptional repressor
MSMNRSGGVCVNLEPAVALFRSLGDRTRLAILERLSHGEARVVDLTRELGLSQSTTSEHLRCLRDCNLVTMRPEGRQSIYALASPGLVELLRAAEKVLADSGNAVALCENYGACCEPAAS